MQPKDRRLVTERNLETYTESELSPVRNTAEAADTRSVRALATSQEAIGESSNAVNRVQQLETVGGLAPGDVTDSQTANLFHQPDSSTRVAFGQALASEIDNESTAGRAAVDVAILASPSVSENALGPLKARLLSVASSPVVIVFAGSSTTHSSYVAFADRWVTMVANGHDVITGYYQATQTVFEPQTVFGSGVTVVNMGRGGTNSTTYITLEETDVIASWSPSLIMHAVGSNDAGTDWGTPDTVAANIAERIDAIDAASNLPVGHVIMHQHERYNRELTAPWKEYLVSARKIAANRPNVSVLDVAQHFAAVGIPSTDPLGMMLSDKVHVNELGQKLYAEIIGDYLELPDVPDPGEEILFDDFNRADGPISETSPTRGEAAWENISGEVVIENGKAFGASFASTAVIETGEQDIDLEVQIERTSNVASGVLFRTLDANNRYGIFTASSGLNLYRVVNGNSTIVESLAATIPHSSYTIRVNTRGAHINVTVSGIGTLTYTIPDPEGEESWTKVGLRDTDGANLYDNLLVTRPAKLT